MVSRIRMSERKKSHEIQKNQVERRNEDFSEVFFEQNLNSLRINIFCCIFCIIKFIAEKINSIKSMATSHESEIGPV